MTATDPRPRLAAALLERLAPAAEALAAACAGDIDAGPPPEDDRDRADYHRAARAGLTHLRQLLAVIDWSARHLPEPEPEPEQDEVHYLGAVWTGRRDTPGFYAWVKQQDRRERRRRKREKKERRERKALAARAGGGRDGGGEEQDAAAGLHDEMEWAPWVGQFQAAFLTGLRCCFSSKRFGLRYPSAECSRLWL